MIFLQPSGQHWNVMERDGCWAVIVSSFDTFEAAQTEALAIANTTGQKLVPVEPRFTLKRWSLGAQT